MITLESDSKYYGTAVFDQWFPWSTYYMPHHTEETMPRKKKSRITFLKTYLNFILDIKLLGYFK